MASPRGRARREPDFGQMLKVLNRQTPDRPVLYEFAINWRLISAFADPGLDAESRGDPAPGKSLGARQAISRPRVFSREAIRETPM